MAHWNNYLWPLVVITSIKRHTPPITLTWYSTPHTTPRHIMMVVTVMVVPILFVHFFFQRWIVRGTAMTGFK